MSASPPDAPLARVAFWYLRHGETDWNARDLSQGTVDVPLNAAGLDQARSAAAILKHRGIRAIAASPLSRARVTAEIVGETLGVAIHFDAELRECAFGVQEGLPMGDWYDRWIAGAFTPEGGEPFAVLRRRAVRAINRAITLPSPVLVIAHGGLFRALRSAMGLAPNLRTRNGVPFWCVPPSNDEHLPWRLEPAEPGVAFSLP